MNSRISLVLKTKNITPAELADEIGVQRSSISHILNGRNKPSLDFIQKLLKKHSDISMSWLLFGEGPMFNSGTIVSAPVQQISQDVQKKPSLLNLFDESDQEETETPAPDLNKEVERDQEIIEPIRSDLRHEPEHANINPPQYKEDPPESPKLPIKTKPLRQENSRTISRIIIFYSDKSFTEYTPGEE